MIPLDVKTRLNSTFHMIDVLYKQRKAVNYWLGTNPQVGKMKLVVSSHWYLIENITDYLKVFERPSRILSGSKYVSLSLVMPEFIEIFTYVESMVKEPHIDVRIKEVFTNAYSILSKY